MSEHDFSGFPPEASRFFQNLKANNNKPWFLDNKRIFEEKILLPARNFVTTLGARLIKAYPDLVAEPKINQSIFRIYRDTRFSQDKTPYKTHLGILFWDGALPKMECPGFYFHFEPPEVMFGGGMHQFSKSQLERFRQLMADENKAVELKELLDQCRNDGFEVGGKHYKRLPKGHDPGPVGAELLLYNGVFCMKTMKLPKELRTSEGIDFSFAIYEKLFSLHEWLKKNMGTDAD